MFDKNKISENVDFFMNTLPNRIKISNNVNFLGNTLSNKGKISDNVDFFENIGLIILKSGIIRLKYLMMLTHWNMVCLMLVCLIIFFIMILTHEMLHLIISTFWNIFCPMIVTH